MMVLIENQISNHKRDLIFSYAKIEAEDYQKMREEEQSLNTVQETIEETTKEIVEETTKEIIKETEVIETTETTTEIQNPLEILVLDGEKRIYTDEELTNCSDYELMILRNGMYALSGRRFVKNQEVIAFFTACDWYVPDVEDDDIVYNRMNDFQKENLDRIRQVEKNRE